MTAAALISASVFAAFGLLVLVARGRERPGRPTYVVSAARIRVIGYLTFAAAILLSARGPSLASGLLLLAGLGLMVFQIVLIARGARAASPSTHGQ